MVNPRDLAGERRRGNQSSLCSKQQKNVRFLLFLFALVLEDQNYVQVRTKQTFACSFFPNHLNIF